MNNQWFPEIMYEDDDNGMTSKIPFVMVPENQVMPSTLFIFESRETGEEEIGPDGEPLPIFEMDLHQYADMNKLKQALDSETYDKVRLALGLEPLAIAVKSGKKISNNIRENIFKKTQVD